MWWIAVILSALALALIIAASIALGVVLATTGRSSRRRDRRLESEIDDLEALVANLTCNCSTPVDVNVTIPTSMVIATSSSTQQVNTGAGPVVITYDSTSTKLLPLLPGMNLSSGVFTAPDDGFYSINWLVGFPSPVPGTPTEVVFGLVSISNWAAEIVNINLPDTGFFTPFTGGVSAILQTNDTVSVALQNVSTANLTVNTGSTLAITKVNDIA